MQRSKLGSYAGYGAPVANGYVRRSQYVTVRDGTLIAVDILHPAADGTMLPGRRPTVVRGTGYRRAFRRGERIAYDVSRLPIIEQYPVGTIITPYELAPVATRLIDHGYVFVSVDLRGTGASFGEYDQPVSLQSGRDLADVVDWIAGQDWSDGKIGMWGRSWEAACQLVTAVAGTRNLSCLFPMGTGLHFESTWYNGLFAVGFKWPYNEMRKLMELDEPAEPVDGPNGERLRAEALANRPSYFPWANAEALGADYKGGLFATTWLERSLKIGAPIDESLGRPRTSVEDAESINRCGAPIYWVEGWWDLNFINSAVSLYNALTVPKKLTVGPWTHSQFAMAHEPHRWFDYWLKGIDNGILAEPEVHYSVSSTDGKTLWRTAERLPVLGENPLKLYMHAPDDVDPRHAGVLEPATPRSHAIRYATGYDVSTGPQTRTTYLWKSVQLNYGDMARRVGRCLTFTTAPLPESIEITGVPALRLAISASASPAAVFVTLEEVQPDGSSHYLTEGILNLEYRTELPLPEHYFGSTLHPAFPSQTQPIPADEWMEVRLDMLALSVHVAAGHCIRVTLAGADHENYYIPPQDPPVVLTLRCGEADGASIELPTIPVAQRSMEATDTFLDDPMPFAFELSGAASRDP